MSHQTPPPAAQGGNITVAGQKLPIHGVVFGAEATGERSIVLSSAGASCDGFPHAEDEDVEVVLHFQPNKDDVWEVELQGDWIDGDQASQIFDKGKLTATPTKAPAGATTLDLALGGSTDVMGYPVALDGKVTAQVCPAK
jgi:hypothetical protein